jgi:hypothetical protein
MFVKLVIVVESLPAEAAERVSLKASLVQSTGPVVASSHVLLELLVLEEFMFVGKEFFVPRTEIAHLLVVSRPNMPMEIRPSKSGKVARRIGTVVS